MSTNAETETFWEVQLTIEEFKFLQKRLPQGFSLIQPQKILNRSSKSTRGLPPPPLNLNVSQPVTEDQSSARREHRPTRVVRNVDHEMAYTTQKLPKNIMDSLKKCKNILASLKKHRCSAPFLRPVDPITLNCPDYFEIIKEPMDLGTVEKKLRNNSYTSPYGFFTDVRKIWSNAFTYNPRNSPVYNMTLEISHYFEDLYKSMEIPNNEDLTVLENKVQKLENKLKELNGKSTKSGAAKDKNGMPPPNPSGNLTKLDF